MGGIIISSTIVKPSSPTPLATKTHKLSYLDQFCPPIYIPLIFFYQNVESEQHEQISRRLKQSLSEILTVFYPLAGTVHGNLYVDCNDRGAEFVEARVHARLSHFLQNPKMEELGRLVHVDNSRPFDEEAVQLSVKLSYFECGGIAVGVGVSHRIADASSLATFVNAWAATCRGEEASGTIRPSFDLALHFPPRDMPWNAGLAREVTGEKIATRRLVFEREKIEKLKKEASRNEVKDPSRVEAVSAFLWRSFIQAFKAEGGERETTSFASSHAVGIRARAVPRFPDHAFGNYITVATAVVTSSEEDDEGALVPELRAAIRGIDDGFIKRLVDVTPSENDGGGAQLESTHCVFSSWLRFPVYEADFGWRKPVWVCTTTMPRMNLVILMDTPSKDGVEAWVNVRDDDFFRFFQANYDKLGVSLDL